ncbi:hypothetical protein, partial [Bacillus subtilis]|uniref:hypothetical protein n=1 Tax=Bacillus subtilis TaxID=1423 RepID=UPI002DB61227
PATHPTTPPNHPTPGSLTLVPIEKTPPSLISDNNHPYSNLKVFLFVSSYGVSPMSAEGFCFSYLQILWK